MLDTPTQSEVTSVRLFFRKNTSAHKASRLIKPEFLRTSFIVDYSDRTDVVRKFRNVFRKDVKIDSNDARAISMFLRRKYLTRTEIYGILLYLGFDYKDKRGIKYQQHIKFLNDI